MNVKEAVRIARDYVADLFREEEFSNLGLEEVVYKDTEEAWEITVGFSRPWDYPVNLFAPFGDRVPRRQYKVVRVNDKTGAVEFVKNRDAK